MCNHDIEFDEVFDINDTDLRYANGVIEIYIRVLMKKWGFLIEERPKLEKAVSKFLTQEYKWHEDHRWNFKPHPDYEDGIRKLYVTGE